MSRRTERATTSTSDSSWNKRQQQPLGQEYNQRPLVMDSRADQRPVDCQPDCSQRSRLSSSIDRLKESRGAEFYSVDWFLVLAR